MARAETNKRHLRRGKPIVFCRRFPDEMCPALLVMTSRLCGGKIDGWLGRPIGCESFERPTPECCSVFVFFSVLSVRVKHQARIEPVAEQFHG